MKRKELPYPSIAGKTYSLFGGTDQTENYFKKIAYLADLITAGHDIPFVIQTIRKASGRRAWLRRQAESRSGASPMAEWLELLEAHLGEYTINARNHLRNLELRKKILDKRLGTTVEQYHLYMLEIELTNRLNKEAFIFADKKIALLPYCLRDFNVKCKAAKNGFDQQCKHCSVNCYQNHASLLLSDNGIEPYIWMGLSLKKLAREILSKNQSLGILGIACIPELTFGIRKVSAYGIPVVGLPLDANRCIRWFGEFHPNSINLGELERLTHAGVGEHFIH